MSIKQSINHQDLVSPDWDQPGMIDVKKLSDLLSCPPLEDPRLDKIDQLERKFEQLEMDNKKKDDKIKQLEIDNKKKDNKINELSDQLQAMSISHDIDRVTDLTPSGFSSSSASAPANVQDDLCHVILKTGSKAGQPCRQPLPCRYHQKSAKKTKVRVAKKGIRRCPALFKSGINEGKPCGRRLPCRMHNVVSFEEREDMMREEAMAKTNRRDEEDEERHRQAHED